jgi:hypothetical protein
MVIASERDRNYLRAEYAQEEPLVGGCDQQDYLQFDNIKLNRPPVPQTVQVHTPGISES